MPMANTYSYNSTLYRVNNLKFGKLFDLSKYLKHT